MGKTAIYSQEEVSNYNLGLLYKYQIVPLSDQNFKHNDYDMTNTGEKPEIKTFYEKTLETYVVQSHINHSLFNSSNHITQ